MTQDLRGAAGDARSAFRTLDQAVSESSTGVRTFAIEGLPQYTRLAMETRDLIARLENLVRQIERDPARFLLNRQEPEFRR